MKLSELQNLTAPLTVTYHDNEFALRFYCERPFDDEWRERIKSAPAIDDSAPQPGEPDENTRVLAGLIASWWLTDDDEQPLAVTVEHVHTLRRKHPGLFKTLIVEIMQAAARPLTAATSANI
jgi:hypothetical protein